MLHVTNDSDKCVVREDVYWNMTTSKKTTKQKSKSPTQNAWTAMRRNTNKSHKESAEVINTCYTKTPSYCIINMTETTRASARKNTRDKNKLSMSSILTRTFADSNKRETERATLL